MTDYAEKIRDIQYSIHQIIRNLTSLKDFHKNSLDKFYQDTSDIYETLEYVKAGIMASFEVSQYKFALLTAAQFMELKERNDALYTWFLKID